MKINKPPIILRQGARVTGLTTAAGLWLTAAVGVAAGMGREATAVLSALIALAILSMPRPGRAGKKAQADPCQKQDDTTPK